MRTVLNRGDEGRTTNDEPRMTSKVGWPSLVVRRWSFISLTTVLGLISLGLIIWTGVVAWQRPCRTTAGSGLVGTPECPSLIFDLGPLLIALGFWAVALLVVWLTDRPDLPDVFFLLFAGALAAGKLSAMGSYPAGRLFYLLLAWLGPLTFHFHYSLLARPAGRLGQIVFGGLYSLAVVFSLPFLLWSIPALQQRG